MGMDNALGCPPASRGEQNDQVVGRSNRLLEGGDERSFDSRGGEVVGSPDPAEVGQPDVSLAISSQLCAAGSDGFEVGEIAPPPKLAP